jgi:TetR/AcrR family transcriptional regulator
VVTRARGRPPQGFVVSDEVLLDAVLQAFGENGYDGSSMREIARRFNISHNLMPQRFGSKMKLWHAAIDHGFSRLQEDLEHEALSLGDDEVEILRGLIGYFIEANALHPSLLQIINQEASLPGPRLDYLFDRYIKPARDFGDAWLTRLAEQGRIAPVSVSLMYFLMTHGAGGMFALPELSRRLTTGARGYSPGTIKEQVENAVSVIFDGVIPR